MHFTYSKEPDNTQLMQGDVIRLTKDFEKTLSEQHPWLFEAVSPDFFMVLTQTCDLVVRPQANGAVECAARYILLTPLQDLTNVVRAYVTRQQNAEIARAASQVAGNGGSNTLPICSSRTKADLGRFLERLFNNNHDDYFYLREVPEKGFPNDFCAELAKTFVLDASLRQACVEAKVLQLTEEFQAKLGTTVGRMYSRVGTRDWVEAEMAAKVAAVSEAAAVWFTDRQYDRLKKLVKAKLKADEGYALSEAELDQLIESMPKKKQETLDAVMDIVCENVAEVDKLKLRRALETSTVISAALKE